MCVGCFFLPELESDYDADTNYHMQSDKTIQRWKGKAKYKVRARSMRASERDSVDSDSSMEVLFVNTYIKVQDVLNHFASMLEPSSITYHIKNGLNVLLSRHSLNPNIFGTLHNRKLHNLNFLTIMRRRNQALCLFRFFFF